MCYDESVIPFTSHVDVKRIPTSLTEGVLLRHSLVKSSDSNHSRFSHCEPYNHEVICVGSRSTKFLWSMRSKLLTNIGKIRNNFDPWQIVCASPGIVVKERNLAYSNINECGAYVFYTFKADITLMSEYGYIVLLSGYSGLNYLNKVYAKNAILSFSLSRKLDYSGPTHTLCHVGASPKRIFVPCVIGQLIQVITKKQIKIHDNHISSLLKIKEDEFNGHVSVVSHFYKCIDNKSDVIIITNNDQSISNIITFPLEADVGYLVISYLENIHNNIYIKGLSAVSVRYRNYDLSKSKLVYDDLVVQVLIEGDVLWILSIDPSVRWIRFIHNSKNEIHISSTSSS